MAVVERAEREVVVLVGVPLEKHSNGLVSVLAVIGDEILVGSEPGITPVRKATHGISEGVSGFDGGG